MKLNCLHGAYLKGLEVQIGQSQSDFSCSKSTMETPEQRVKSALWTGFTYYQVSSLFTLNK